MSSASYASREDYRHAILTLQFLSSFLRNHGSLLLPLQNFRRNPSGSSGEGGGGGGNGSEGGKRPLAAPADPETSRVKRALFGPVDHDENLRFVKRELQKNLAEQSKKYNFDFESGRPLKVEGGRWEWEVRAQLKIMLKVWVVMPTILESFSQFLATAGLHALAPCYVVMRNHATISFLLHPERVNVHLHLMSSDRCRSCRECLHCRHPLQRRSCQKAKGGERREGANVIQRPSEDGVQAKGRQELQV